VRRIETDTVARDCNYRLIQCLEVLEDLGEMFADDLDGVGLLTAEMQMPSISVAASSRGERLVVRDNDRLVVMRIDRE
jgi:hypothetical protein